MGFRDVLYVLFPRICRRYESITGRSFNQYADNHIVNSVFAERENRVVSSRSIFRGLDTHWQV